MSEVAHGLLSLWAVTTAVGAVLLGLLVAVQTGARRLRRPRRRARRRQPVR